MLCHIIPIGMTEISKGCETAGRIQDKFKKRNNDATVTDDVSPVKDSFIVIRVKVAPTETKCEQKLPQLLVGRDFRCDSASSCAG